jgi:ATP-dependent HslUV protease ATP-binding subunit HslU
MLPVEELTPRQIVSELDRYIVGQERAKKAVAVALRNRFRRQQLPEHQRDDIMPKNILMMGPTGVGKTEIARRLAQLARAPFVKVEATKFTEVGYVGRDVESMIRELVAAAVRLVEKEKMETARPEAERRARERLVDMLDEDEPRPYRSHLPGIDNPAFRQAYEMFGDRFQGELQATETEEEPPFDEEAYQRRREERRAKLDQDIMSGALNDKIVEVETEEASNPFLQVFSAQGVEEMGLDTNPLNSPFPSKRTYRKVTVKEALPVLIEDEARRMIDKHAVHREALVRAEQTGIIFLDEIDKVASKQGGSGPDVSREGVQRDLLPIIEGSTVATKFGPCRTDHILFIAAGAFHMSKVSDLIPELQGRLPIRVELEALHTADFRRILTEPQNALTKQYQLLLSVEGVQISFTDGALDEIANVAAAVNEKAENIGARRLHTVMERLLQELLFDAPETDRKNVVFDEAAVKELLEPLVKESGKGKSVI